MGPEHSRHRAIGVAGDDMAAVLDPQVTAILATAPVLDAVALVALGDIGLEMRHHPRIVLRVYHAFPGQHGVVQRVTGVTQHRVPARVAVDVAAVGIPVPDAVADQFEQGVQLLLGEASRYRLCCLTHGRSPCCPATAPRNRCCRHLLFFAASGNTVPLPGKHIPSERSPE
ncbi:hypothetical protein WR25_14998 [Diploscapter pachys]|uniref:Uncharacterized protein n=1 Tax=Diploscapter pachys TaxID=2018661 RepID=A0A2A2JZ55_9BILA|nr:hypothetical protein WR25_14998 [Diploscapter pachys]